MWWSETWRTVVRRRGIPEVNLIAQHLLTGTTYRGIHRASGWHLHLGRVQSEMSKGSPSDMTYLRKWLGNNWTQYKEKRCVLIIGSSWNTLVCHLPFRNATLKLINGSSASYLCNTHSFVISLTLNNKLVNFLWCFIYPDHKGLAWHGLMLEWWCIRHDLFFFHWK